MSVYRSSVKDKLRILTDLFQLLKTPVRARIFLELWLGHQTSVKALRFKLKLTPAAVDYHLKQLRQANLIEAVQLTPRFMEREYRLTASLSAALRFDLLRMALLDAPPEVSRNLSIAYVEVMHELLDTFKQQFGQMSGEDFNDRVLDRNAGLLGVVPVSRRTAEALTEKLAPIIQHILSQDDPDEPKDSIFSISVLANKS